MITWWLYYNGEPIASVRADEHASTQDVLTKALAQHDAVPLCFPTPPLEHRTHLMRAEVRR